MITRQQLVHQDYDIVRAPQRDPIGEYMRTREWQDNGFYSLTGERHAILNASTGAGKSKLAILLAEAALQSEQALRCVITTPQTGIGTSFLDDKIVDPDGRKILWHPQCNLINGSDNRAEELVAFLDRKAHPLSINSRIAVCTNATLRNAFKLAPELFTNLILVVDEAHHVQITETVNAGVINNGNGEVVRHCYDEPTCRILLVTATHFRGDRTSILTEEMTKSFTEFSITFDEYLRCCEYLRSISIDLVMYGTSPYEALKTVFDKGLKKPIIHIPPIGTKASLGCKFKDVGAVLEAIAGERNPRIEQDAKTGMTIVHCTNGEKKVIADLVDDRDEERRERAKRYIDKADKHSDASLIDAIISLNIFREGANWCWADQTIILGPRGSLLSVIQMQGRALRDAPGKSHVETIIFLPMNLMDDIEKTREDWNTYVKAVVVCMLMQNVIEPRLPYIGDGDSKVKSLKVRSTENPLFELFDAAEAEEFCFKVLNEMLDWLAVYPKASVNKQKHHLYAVVNSMLGKRFCKISAAKCKRVAKVIWRNNAKATLKMEGILVDSLNMDLLDSTGAFDWMLCVPTKRMCKLTFAEVKRKLGKQVFLSFAEARAKVRNENIEKQEAYQKWQKSHPNMPSNPSDTYSDEWISWGHFLRDEVKIPFLTFAKACKKVRKAGVVSSVRYNQWQKDHADMPSSPNVIYRKEWISWPHFFNTKRRVPIIKGKDRRFRAFDEARQYARSLGLETWGQWTAWTSSRQRPRDIPSMPNKTYAGQYKDMADWLGSSRNWLSFEEARAIVRKLEMKSQPEYKRWSSSGNRPKGIPSDPKKTYSDQWVSWGDWLGNDSLKKRRRNGTNFLPFDEARKLVTELGFGNREEFLAWNRPYNIPSNPSSVYKNSGWISWGDFLGTGFVHPRNKKFLPFDEARAIVQKAGIGNSKYDWLRWSKTERPHNIPAGPWTVYKGHGWKGMRDWLRSEAS